MPAILRAQEVVQALPGTTDADRLAEQMRALASNPRDLNALIAAGDLSLSLGDLSGAASLYARAEKVSANDPRIKAGEGAILVRSERPGEALRYFAQAEAAGYDARGFAADRGLAYDLVGQQERAQRDYRLALKTRPDDEVVKRYALSLGISGKRDAALEQLDPLLRKTDRSAWRIRAFVLAMGGDQSGAEKIATTMLPAGMAQGLLPFFQRLPTLPAADRAFAVHFGEVRATPERLADARLVPALPQLAPEAAPVALAAVQPPSSTTRNDRRGRNRGGREVIRTSGVAVAAVQPQPVAPSYAAAAAALTRVQAVPSRPASAPVTLASASTVATAAPAGNVSATAMAPAAASQAIPRQAATVQPLTAAPAVASANVATVQAATVSTVTTAQAANADVLRQVAPAQASSPVTTAAAATAPAIVAPQSRPPVQLASVEPLPRAAAAPAPALASAAERPPAAVNVAAVRGTEPAPVVAPTAVSPAATRGFAAPPSRAEADSVLARIVAGLSIPAAELGVAPPARAVPVAAEPAPDTAARVIAEARAKEERDAAAQKALAAKAAADKRAADRKAIADKKALAAKKLADDKKLADAKAAAEEKKAPAEEKKAARANPERIWVQVAGGANENDLPKAYAAVKAKATAVFGGRAAWSTPLRATNRVLVGPFKTDAEARTFVNQLAKAGVSAFTFTSDAGQAVTKLPPK